MTVVYPSPTPVQGRNGSFQVTFDAHSQIIYMVRTGYHDSEEIEAHFERLLPLLQGLRSSGVPVRVMADMRLADVMSPEKLEKVSARWTSIYQPGERIALIGLPSLVKMQIRRVMTAFPDGADIRYFPSFDDGDDWLRMPVGSSAA